ncbi:hypothetical protein B0E52_04075 [Rhodanobacter sp. C06]|uniref:DUF1294 domain-containing protein n=1 Tax=Rhodanobacter sp. C06 TaxID=1945854 RepID=UPI00098590D9|nr:DUF1294 domain-containing protein [Rhodanobacter sp. C06]OOG47250.1 hypothetical protein B0E52_04075 [Rhodanobacter sp. C06]
MRFQGRVIEWNDERGYGQIVTHGDQQRIFLHIKYFAAGRTRRPKVDDILTYAVVAGERGRPRADAVAFAATKPGRGAGAQLSKGSVLPVWGVTLFVAVLFAMAWQERVPWLVLAAYGAMSTVTFLVYWRDKRAAQEGRWRTPESTLQGLALLCGWPGAWLAQGRLRHKSSKRPFLAMFWAMVACNIAGLLWLAPRLAGMFS